MKFRIISDIHTELYKSENLFVLPKTEFEEETVLLLAGDIGNVNGYNLNKLMQFLINVNHRFHRVLYIFGNHEYYHADMMTTRGIIQERLDYYKLDKVKILDNSTYDFVDEKIRIIGATLWTDCNKSDPNTIMVVNHFLNDFHVINLDEKRFRVEDSIFLHDRAKDYIGIVCDQTPDDWKRILLVHHGVTYKSIHPRYAGQVQNAGFVSDLSNELIDWEIDLAVHGHVHTPFDYMVGDRCRVIANPYGYPNENNFEHQNVVVEL